MFGGIFMYFVLIGVFTLFAGALFYLWFRGLDSTSFGTLIDSTIACLGILTMGTSHDSCSLLRWWCLPLTALIATALFAANYPDVQFGLEKQNRAYTALFTCFVVAGVMFLLSLVLGVVYKSYSGTFKTKLKNKILRVDGAPPSLFRPSSLTFLTIILWWFRCAGGRLRCVGNKSR
jgi:hypothetical protein